MGSARGALWMAMALGLPMVNPNLLNEAEAERDAERLMRAGERPHRPSSKPYDHEAAARIRAEREARKAANYRKRYNLPPKGGDSP